MICSRSSLAVHCEPLAAYPQRPAVCHHFHSCSISQSRSGCRSRRSCCRRSCTCRDRRTSSSPPRTHVDRRWTNWTSAPPLAWCWSGRIEGNSLRNLLGKTAEKQTHRNEETRKSVQCESTEATHDHGSQVLLRVDNRQPQTEQISENARQKDDQPKKQEFVCLVHLACEEEG